MEFTQEVLFCVWLLSLCIMFLKFIYCWVYHSLFPFFLLNSSTLWIYHNLSVDGHLGLQFGWKNVNKTAMNICVLVFAWAYIFISVGRIPRSRMAESCSLHVTWQGTAKQFSKVVVWFHFPNSHVKVTYSLLKWWFQGLSPSKPIL